MTLWKLVAGILLIILGLQMSSATVQDGILEQCPNGDSVCIAEGNSTRQLCILEEGVTSCQPTQNISLFFAKNVNSSFRWAANYTGNNTFVFSEILQFRSFSKDRGDGIVPSNSTGNIVFHLNNSLYLNCTLEEGVQSCQFVYPAVFIHADSPLAQFNITLAANYTSNNTLVLATQQIIINITTFLASPSFNFSFPPNTSDLHFSFNVSFFNLSTFTLTQFNISADNQTDNASIFNITNNGTDLGDVTFRINLSNLTYAMYVSNTSDRNDAILATEQAQIVFRSLGAGLNQGFWLFFDYLNATTDTVYNFTWGVV